MLVTLSRVRFELCMSSRKPNIERSLRLSVRSNTFSNEQWNTSSASRAECPETRPAAVSTPTCAESCSRSCLQACTLAVSRPWLCSAPLMASALVSECKLSTFYIRSYMEHYGVKLPRVPFKNWPEANSLTGPGSEFRSEVTKLSSQVDPYQ